MDDRVGIEIEDFIRFFEYHSGTGSKTFAPLFAGQRWFRRESSW